MKNDGNKYAVYGIFFRVICPLITPTVSILPSVLIFFFQKYLVEGVATSGIKG